MAINFSPLILYGKCASEKKDYDLALSLLSSTHPEHLSLREKINKAIDKRNAAHKLSQTFKQIATISIVMLFCIMSVSFFWIQNERNKAVAEKERAIKVEAIALEEKSRSAIAENRALVEKERAVLAENIAITEKENAVKAESLVQIEKERAERLNYFTHIALAETKFQQAEIKQGLQLLKETQSEYRGWEYGRLLHLANLDQLSIGGHSAGVESLAFSPDGQWATSAAAVSSEVKLWELKTGKVIRTINFHGAAVSCVDFSPDSDRILTGSWEKKS